MSADERRVGRETWACIGTRTVESSGGIKRGLNLSPNQGMLLR